MLEFRADQMEREVHAFLALAGEFLDPSSVGVARDLITQLDAAKAAAADTKVSLYIDRDRPLRTRESKGEYEKGHRGGQPVYGELSFAWEVSPIGNNSRKFRNRRVFRITGIASTEAVVRAKDESPIVTWWTDVGTKGHPGPVLHVQLESSVTDFPVPRLPAVVVSPFSVLDFILAELFQDDWSERSSSDTDARRQWNNLQSARWHRLLSWMAKRVENGASTPWIAIKEGRPPVDLLDH